MRLLILALAAAVATPALAQPAPGPPPPTKLFAPAAEIAAVLAQHRADQAAGKPSALGKPLINLAPYRTGLEYRTSVMAAAVHEKEAEWFYVVDGSGVVTTGGKLVNEKRMDAENLSGAGIEGGESRPVAKGDMFIVPENTPHWFSTINGALVMFSMHVPRPVAKP